jgi:hypothetical protein
MHGEFADITLRSEPTVISANSPCIQPIRVATSLFHVSPLSLTLLRLGEGVLGASNSAHSGRTPKTPSPRQAKVKDNGDTCNGDVAERERWMHCCVADIAFLPGATCRSPWGATLAAATRPTPPTAPVGTTVPFGLRRGGAGAVWGHAPWACPMQPRRLPSCARLRPAYGRSRQLKEAPSLL